MQWLELRIPPPLVAALTAAGMWYSSRWMTPFPWSGSVRLGIAMALGCAAMAISFGGFFAFRKAKTTIDPTRPQKASALVTSGVYRFTRNPMYVGLLLLLTGWSVYLSAVLPFVCLPLFVLYMTRFQIIPEERALRSRFGDEYVSYVRRVRRWL